MLIFKLFFTHHWTHFQVKNAIFIENMEFVNP